MKTFQVNRILCTLLLLCVLLFPSISLGKESLKFEKLVINPKDLPTSCGLSRTSKPQIFKPTDDFPNDFLGFVIQPFWFIDAVEVDLSKLRVGFSNVLSNSTSKDAVVHIGLAFKSAAMAEKGSEYLEKTYAKQSNFSQIRRGKILTYFVHDKSVTNQCRSAFREKLLQSIKGKAE